MITADQLLPCPFCGNAPEVNEEPATDAYNTTWVHVSCRKCEARPHTSGSRQVWQWVGNDVPRETYCTVEESLASARASAFVPWNRRYVALPSQWKIECRSDVFKSIFITAPNGYRAVVSSVERNPANILYMLAGDLAKQSEKH